MGSGKSDVAKGGGGGVREIRAADGSVIDLGDTPLVYGQNDGAVSGNARAVVEAWEAKRVKNSIEYNMSVDQDGNPISQEKRGGKTSTRVPVSALQAGAIHSHIHPRTDTALLGGTFSDADLYNFANYGVNTYRAKAKEGAYSISKGKSFDSNGFKSYVKNLYQKEHALSASAHAMFRQKISTDANYTYKSYIRDANKAFNSMLVAVHNGLIAGQQKYGYSYTLEK